MLGGGHASSMDAALEMEDNIQHVKNQNKNYIVSA